jgi:thiamine-phosphate pyrophosphorylase
MKSLFDCRLYAFVDTAWLDGQSVTVVARQLCDGGADLIQLRAKGESSDTILELAQQILPITQRAKVRLVINDYWNVAAAAGASVVHLGQEDFFDNGYTHRDQLPPETRTLELGLSTHAPDQAIRAVKAGADYVAIGPVFATGTKPTAMPTTLDYVRWAAANISIPWFAIGGINLANLDEVIAAGARRVCVVSAILKAPDITKACQLFKDRLLSAAET